MMDYSNNEIHISIGDVCLKPVMDNYYYWWTDIQLWQLKFDLKNKLLEENKRECQRMH